MGERRLRAARLAEVDRIPVIVRQTEDDAMLRDALLENIHRVQLHPLEEAAAYQQLIDEFGVTHEELAQRIKRSRPVISNDGWEHTVSDIWGIHDYTQFKQQLVDRYGTAEAVDRTLNAMTAGRRRILLEPEHRRDQPVMLTEFGGLSYRPKSGEAWFGYATAQTDDEYLAMMNALFEAIYDSTELAGFCYTQITDTLQETNGLYDENRQPKLPIDRLRDIIMRPSRAVPSESLDIARQKALRVSFGQVV